MIRRIFVTLGALLLINAGPSSSNTHTVQVMVSQPIDLRSAHTFLGIAVLGHHVGRIERGWIVKQANPGYLHIDWTKGGQWAGLERAKEGPRDVSQAQLDEVVRVIERLGYPASAIRAWRVPAPVGYDGFQEGDKVLTIGEILVDLGTVDDARLALARWWDVVLKDDNDPFEQIPGTNVRYAFGLYFQPDCLNFSQQLQRYAIEHTQPIAQAAAVSDGLSATFSAYDSTVPENVLCPQDRRPNFYDVSGGPPIAIHAFDLVDYQHASVTYMLSGTALTGGTASADDLRASSTRFEFPLNVPYAATIGDASVKMKPDARVLQFTYDLGAKARKDYASDLIDVQRQVARLQSLVKPGDSLVRRFPAKEREDEMSVFVLVRGDDLSALNNLLHARLRDQSESVTHTAFVSNCSAAMRTAVSQALAASKRKAAMLARLIHAKIHMLGATRITDPIGTNVVCGYDPSTPLSTLVAQIPASSGPVLNDTLDVWAEASVNAAWTLTGTAPSNAPLVRAEYRADVRGTLAAKELMNRALLQAAREAVVDNSHIVSLYEMPETFEDGGAGDANSASATIVVLRPGGNST